MKRFFYIFGMAVWLLASGCSETSQVPGTEGEDATFQIFTRANESPSVNQKAWLYLATREAENDNILLCNTTYDVGTGFFTLENNVSQWYKMAFVCVPYCATAKVELPEPKTGEYNDIVLDYTPVLKVTGQSETEDLAIYRKVIDRWLIPGESLNEDVTMTRITGQLILDMGILKDQFPKKVTNITVTLTGIPTAVYLRDNSNDEVIYPENSARDLVYSFDNPNWGDDETHFRMCFNLLPCTLSGSKQETEGQITVSGCRVKVEYEGGSEEYPIGTTDQITPSVQIIKNLRTTVYFNGMENGEFEVRYAGFDGTSIGVDSDDWDGWNTNE